MDWKNITKEELKSLIDSRTYMSIGDMFGISDAAVKKKAKKFGIWVRKKQYNGHNDHLKGTTKNTVKRYCWWCGEELKHTSKKYCKSQCQSEYLNGIYINKWMLGVLDGSRCHGFCISRNIRTYLFKKHNNKCSKCGWSERNTKSGNIPLQIDHIDGNYKNNKESNLRLLCPNCHSLTPTFGSLNKGSGDRDRQEYFGGFLRKR